MEDGCSGVFTRLWKEYPVFLKLGEARLNFSQVEKNIYLSELFLDLKNIFPINDIGITLSLSTPPRI